MPDRTPIHGRSSLILSITVRDSKLREKMTQYLVRFLESDEELGGPAWRLRKIVRGRASKGPAYDVIVKEHGPECTCPDWIYARDGKDAKGCKHIAALRSLGLLSSEVKHVRSDS